MSDTRKIDDYSRQELYDLVWSTPVAKLSLDFGISDVAIAKRCIKRNIPRPRRGYWAKIEAGKNARKVPLPPTPDELFKQQMQRRVRKSLSLPGDGELLLPLASELMTAITKARVDDYKRTRLEDPKFPEVTITKKLAERAAKAFHVLLSELEPFGIRFRKFTGKYEGGFFQRQGDRLFIYIEENIVQPDGTKVTETWRQYSNAKPSGYLTFRFKTGRWHARETKEWSETRKLPLEKCLSQIVAGINSHFLDLQVRHEQEKIESARRHAEWLERTRIWEQKEALRIQKEKERKHADALAETAHAREVALRKAAKRWRRSCAMLDFIQECETRWKSQAPELSPEQTAWLKWARDLAAVKSPFSVGYPDPAIDGAFDPAAVPFGGPYPPARDFEPAEPESAEESEEENEEPC